jgi:hypothetical protein
VIPSLHAVGLLHALSQIPYQGQELILRVLPATVQLVVSLGGSEALASQVPIPAALTHPLDHLGVLLHEWGWGLLHTCRLSLAFQDLLLGALSILEGFSIAPPELLELDCLR